MLEVTKINKGIVIDHIKAGVGYKIFNHLGLQKADYSVALIMNVESKKLGFKDIIKISNIIDVDVTSLGLLSPEITINIVKNETIKDKITPDLPTIVENILKCSNPRCITKVENTAPHLFKLTNREKGIYRCVYCDETHNPNK